MLNYSIFYLVECRISSFSFAKYVSKLNILILYGRPRRYRFTINKCWVGFERSWCVCWTAPRLQLWCVGTASFDFLEGHWIEHIQPLVLHTHPYGSSCFRPSPKLIHTHWYDNDDLVSKRHIQLYILFSSCSLFHFPHTWIVCSSRWLDNYMICL